MQIVKNTTFKKDFPIRMDTFDKLLWTLCNTSAVREHRRDKEHQLLKTSKSQDHKYS